MKTDPSPQKVIDVLSDLSKKDLDLTNNTHTTENNSVKKLKAYSRRIKEKNVLVNNTLFSFDLDGYCEVDNLGNTSLDFKAMLKTYYAVEIFDKSDIEEIIRLENEKNNIEEESSEELVEEESIETVEGMLPPEEDLEEEDLEEEDLEEEDLEEEDLEEEDLEEEDLEEEDLEEEDLEEEDFTGDDFGIPTQEMLQHLPLDEEESLEDEDEDLEEDDEILDDLEEDLL